MSKHALKNSEELSETFFVGETTVHQIFKLNYFFLYTIFKNTFYITLLNLA